MSRICALAEKSFELGFAKLWAVLNRKTELLAERGSAIV
jgi:hypothetical protein